MKVEFLNLKRQYAKIAPELENAVLECLRSGAYIEGPKVKELENKLSNYLGVSHVITCGNGTDALMLALQASGIKAGDEVITTPFSFFATSEAIAAVGAIPVFVDVRKNDYNINPDKIEEKITDKTKAILPVHIFGMSADMDIINKIAEKYNLVVIEDAAQAIGCSYHGKKAGSLGTVGCFSFYPTKNLGACGDAGMVTTNDENIANAVRAFKAHAAGKIGAKAFEYLEDEKAECSVGESGATSSELYDPYKYYNYLIGRNSRLDSIQAAVLLVKFEHLEEYNSARCRIANKYNSALNKLPIQLPSCINEGECWHQYAIMVPDREKFVQHMCKCEIGTGAFYPVPLHLQKAFKGLKYKKGDYPVAEWLCEHSVCLPVFPELTEEEQDYVIESIVKYFEVN
ncbi:UDP-2-acetamido-2-deoxy-3-oxo-D-glucuronate aminotransferase [Lachnospiraceae bacterium]|nr:UDP-2-acetamido-2-deoxy-3-oxo-D-glucuronate aminotransferase [Lachnospiraceae bacterium]